MKPDAEKMQIMINGLDTRRALKLYLLKEIHRHKEDIRRCQRDVDKLQDVDLPHDLINNLGWWGVV
jgi:hypothetical protein